MLTHDDTQRRFDRSRQAGDASEIVTELSRRLAQMDALIDLGWHGPAADQFARTVVWLREDLARARDLVERGAQLLRAASL